MLQGREKGIRKEKAMGGDERRGMDLLRLLWKDSIGAFVGLYRDTLGEKRGKQADDTVWLELEKSQYVIAGICRSCSIKN